MLSVIFYEMLFQCMKTVSLYFGFQLHFEPKFQPKPKAWIKPKPKLIPKPNFRPKTKNFRSLILTKHNLNTSLINMIFLQTVILLTLKGFKLLQCCWSLLLNNLGFLNFFSKWSCLNIFFWNPFQCVIEMIKFDIIIKKQTHFYFFN